MAKQNINVGTSANDKTGDSLRQAFIRVNENFTELYEAVGLADTGQDTALTFVGSTIGTDDSSSIVIDRATTITSNLSVGGNIVPQTALGGDLGSSTLPWRSLYVSNNTIFLGGVPLGLDANGNLTTGGTVVGSTPAWNSITGKPTFATVATSGAYADLTGRPTSFNSLVTGAYSVNLESGGVLRANVQGIVSDNQLAVEGSTLISIQTLDGPYLQLFNQGATKEINLVAWDGESLSAPTWSFDTDRTLTLPNDSGIKSATNIDITIDTPDSSTFNWRFGADGSLTLPSVGKINNGVYDWTFGTDGELALPGILKIDDGVHEKFQTKADATGIVTHDCSLGHIFYHTSPDALFTVNFTNLNLTSGYATALTLIIEQGGTGFIPNSVGIGGVLQTLNWQGNITPTPSTNRTDVVTFSIINNSGTYIVLGQLTGF